MLYIILFLKNSVLIRSVKMKSEMTIDRIIKKLIALK